MSLEQSVTTTVTNAFTCENQADQEFAREGSVIGGKRVLEFNITAPQGGYTAKSTN